MDLREYYRKLKETETTLEGDSAVVVSMATPEGGKAGVRTDAPRAVAARLIVDGRARLATKEEAEAFHASQREAKAHYEEEQAARRLQVMVVPSHEIRNAKDRT